MNKPARVTSTFQRTATGPLSPSRLSLSASWPVTTVKAEFYTRTDLYGAVEEAVVLSATVAQSF